MTVERVTPMPTDGLRKSIEARYSDGTRDPTLSIVGCFAQGGGPRIADALVSDGIEPSGPDGAPAQPVANSSRAAVKPAVSPRTNTSTSCKQPSRATRPWTLLCDGTTLAGTVFQPRCLPHRPGQPSWSPVARFPWPPTVLPPPRDWQRQHGEDLTPYLTPYPANIGGFRRTSYPRYASSSNTKWSPAHPHVQFTGKSALPDQGQPEPRCVRRPRCSHICPGRFGSLATEATATATLSRPRVASQRGEGHSSRGTRYRQGVASYRRR